MSVLADRISPGARDLFLHFPSERGSSSFGDVWEAGRPVAGWLAARGTAPVAMVLSNTLACATALVGAIAAGAHVVSIPPPIRGADLEAYARFVGTSCAQTGATSLVVDASYLARMPPLPEVTYTSYDEMLRARVKGTQLPERFALTQFTSGNTREPRGVTLTEVQVTANVEAIVRWLEPEAGDGFCSWFPLSNVVGLIVMFLAGIVGCGPDWADGGDVVLLSPEVFRRRPASWLEACAHYGSTVTANAPNFGFQVAVARPPAAGLDLSRLRVCITGAEPIRAQTLMTFAEAFGPTGFAELALCPGYGVTECAMATGTPPFELWHSLTVDPEALANGRLVPDESGFAVMSSGVPLPDHEVTIAGEGPVGEILVGGPSVAAGYADGSSVTEADGVLVTGDVGFVDDGHLFVVGRREEIFAVGGRMVYAVDLEGRVGYLPGLRLGRVVAAPGTDGELLVVAERDVPGPASATELGELDSAVRAVLRDRIGEAPLRVGIAARRQLPLSLNGKVQRFRVREEMLEGGYPTVD